MVKIQKKPRIICDPMKGQNYWFNGCMEYLMESLSESNDYDYWFFSGITGDSFTQIYCKDISDIVFCYSDRFLQEIIKNLSNACGYNFDYFSNLSGKNPEAYNNMIKAYINKGIPVIAKTIDEQTKWTAYGCIYGYDDEKYYAICGDNIEKTINADEYCELIFVKERKNKNELTKIYKNAVMNIPFLIDMQETDGYAFGKKAFMYWADSFQNSTFDKIPIEENNIWYTHPDRGFSCWNMHGNYLCMLGTNNCAIDFLEKALHYNPDMQFINDLIPLYKKINSDGFDKLMGMAGGFQIKPKDLKDKNLMKPITEEINGLSKYCDDIIEIFNGVMGKRANCT
jgi:tetratricopeptide (TPR) repeat protein